MSRFFRAHFGVIQRTRGGSAVRRAAYQACTQLFASDGREFNYSDRKKRHGHFQTLVVAPDNSPQWATDVGSCWKMASAAENRVDAQEARTLELSLPYFLPKSLWVTCAHFLARFFVDHGMIVQVDIHAPLASSGVINLHLHLLLTMRRIEHGEFSRLKARDWNGLFYPAKSMRARLAQKLTEFCKDFGIDYEADPRSNAERGLPPPERTLPRWNFITQRRSRVRTPWLRERDEYREARRGLAQLEDNLAEVKREIRKNKRLAELEHRLAEVARQILLKKAVRRALRPHHSPPFMQSTDKVSAAPRQASGADPYISRRRAKDIAPARAVTLHQHQVSSEEEPLQPAPPGPW